MNDILVIREYLLEILNAQGYKCMIGLPHDIEVLNYTNFQDDVVFKINRMIMIVRAERLKSWPNLVPMTQYGYCIQTFGIDLRHDLLTKSVYAIDHLQIAESDLAYPNFNGLDEKVTKLVEKSLGYFGDSFDEWTDLSS